VLVRGTGDPVTLVPGLQRIVHSLDASLPLFGVEPLRVALGESIGTQRFSMLLLLSFAALALVLALLGVYGVLAQSVASRTREIGIRSALGADFRRLRALVLGEGARLVGLGLVVGLAGAVAVTRLLGALLFDVGARDPLTLAGVALVLALFSLIACWLPARRAARVDPVVALRVE
jgi:putative ABC transport system permease protein